MEHADPHDAELMRRWQGGDVAAFVELVRRWQGPMARLLARLSGRPDQAADLCQEVFLRVYVKGARYRETGAFASWIYQIALNVARDAGRRRRHMPRGLEDHDPPVAGPVVDDLCEQEELATAVENALAELAEPLRQVLVLRHYEGMSFEQMARVLKTPASTLKSRFAVALAALRKCLKSFAVF
jgi:RNA polymerase sigma-70 factor (ECF subfamily)